MKQPTSFLYEQDEHGIATITLNRPERLNALTFEVYRELTDTSAALRDEWMRASSGDRPVLLLRRRRPRHHRRSCSAATWKGLLEFTRMTCELIQNIRATKTSHRKPERHDRRRGRLHRSRFRHSHRERRRQNCVSVCEGWIGGN